jgi:ketosteroid isomerase-like protein
MPDANTVFGAVDGQDVDRLGELLSDDARFVMGNGDPLIGREAVLAGNAAFFTMVQGLRHSVLREWAVGSAMIVEAEVTYLRLDGKEVSIPAVTIWETDQAGLITEFRIFADQAPLFAV